MAGRRIHVVMDASLWERVAAAASGLGMSRGEFVRRAVERALSENPSRSDVPDSSSDTMAPEIAAAYEAIERWYA